jgi:hypothetical protein
VESPDRRDLPGNDASWYRALLDENTDGTGRRTTAQQATVLDAPADASPDANETAEANATAVEPAALAVDSDPDVNVAEDGAAVDTAGTEDDSVAGVAAEPGGDEALEIEEPGEPEVAADHVDAERDEARPQVSPVPDLDAEEALATTSEMVGQLWTSQEESTPFDDWEPDAMDRKIKSARPFRWTSVIGSLAVIGLIVVGLVLLPSITRNRASDHREMMVAALWDLRAELPDAQSSLLTATEPATTVSGLNDLSTQLTVLAAKASDVDEAGRTELPAAPPLTSSGPIDELEPIQQRLEPLATTANTIQRRISNLVEYRSLMAGFLALPDLPNEADSATQADLRVILASAQAQSASVLADLPSDVSLSAHQELARETNEVFASWQVDYLEALRNQDAMVAEALVAELDAQLAELEAELVTPLAQIRRQTDADLIDLAQAIDEVLTLARGNTPAPS